MDHGQRENVWGDSCYKKLNFLYDRSILFLLSLEVTHFLHIFSHFLPSFSMPMVPMYQKPEKDVIYGRESVAERSPHCISAHPTSTFVRFSFDEHTGNRQLSQYSLPQETSSSFSTYLYLRSLDFLLSRFPSSLSSRFQNFVLTTKAYSRYCEKKKLHENTMQTKMVRNN